MAAMMVTFAASATALTMPATRLARATCPRMSVSGEEELLARFGLPTEQITTTRRSAVGLGLAAAAMSPLVAFEQAAHADDAMFTLPPLPYAYVRRRRPRTVCDKITIAPPLTARALSLDSLSNLCAQDALEPHVDAATMKFHHDFHHQAYITNLNKAMAGKPAASLASLMPGAKGAKLNNAGGGHYNHCMFWTIMGPGKGGAPSGDLAAKINDKFGDFDSFKEAWSAAAAGVFGSGWAWLVVNKDGSVDIVTSPNQDNPLMDGAACLPPAPPHGAAPPTRGPLAISDAALPSRARPHPPLPPRPMLDRLGV